MESARHLGFIWAAYGVTGLSVAALVLRAVLSHRVQVRALARLEGRMGASGRWAAGDPDR
jgi:heme exporter protein CcmD